MGRSRSSSNPPVAAIRGRVLIADVDPFTRELAARALRSAGWAVELRSTGREAVASAGAGGIDLALLGRGLDLVLGEHPARCIRALPGDAGRVPILALTPDADPDTRQFCLHVGANDLLVSPFTLGELFGAVCTWVPPRADEPAILPGLLEDLEAEVGATSAARMAEGFQRDVAARIRCMHAAARASDHAAMVRMCQAVRGAATDFGARRLAYLAREAELHERHGGLDVAAAARRLVIMEGELGRVARVLAARRLGADPRYDAAS